MCSFKKSLAASLILTLTVLTTGCNSHSPKEREKASIDSLFEKCDVSRRIIPAATHPDTIELEVSEAVAIEFWPLYKLRAAYDSLPRDKKQGKWPGPFGNDTFQTYYRVGGNYAAYRHFVKPFLDSIKVRSISGDSIRSFITFMNNDKSYTIDVRPFLTTDAIILYCPGKEPVMWNWDSLPCQTTYFIGRYFNGK
jgi:hypothetical protein